MKLRRRTAFVAELGGHGCAYSKVPRSTMKATEK